MRTQRTKWKAENSYMEKVLKVLQSWNTSHKVIVLGSLASLVMEGLEAVPITWEAEVYIALCAFSTAILGAVL